MRLSTYSANPAKERGAILVAVLLIVTVMSLLVVSLGRDVRSNANLAQVEFEQLRSRTILDSAIDVAAAKILAAKIEVGLTLKEQVQRLLLGSATVELRISDAGGLLDIAKADPDLLRAVLDKVVGESADSEALANAILKRRSDVATKSAGDLPFQTTAELYDLIPDNSQLVDRLMPLIGLYSKDGRLNARASPIILIESLPGITSADVEQIAELRGRIAADAAFRDILARYGKYLTIAPGSIYQVDAEIVGGAHLIKGSSIRAAIALDRESRDTPYQVVSLSW